MNWLEEKTLGAFVKSKGRLSKPFFAGKGFMLMLHRVLPEKIRNSYTLNRSLAITPEKLEEFILFFKEKGYRFVAIDELYTLLSGGILDREKIICLTIDDGYKDNFQFALPVFQKHTIPASIYITNCLPNGNAIFWWYLCERHFGEKQSLTFQTDEWKREFRWRNKDEAFQQFQDVSNTIKSISIFNFRESIKLAFDVDESGLREECETLAMTWSEIIELSNEKLITIGGHTLNHYSLKKQKLEVAREEMLQSKKELEVKLNKEICHFAYPYGGLDDADSREYSLAKELGFKTAVLNRPGNIFPSQKHFFECLPRMPLSNETSRERLEHYMNGIYHFASNGFMTNISY